MPLLRHKTSVVSNSTDWFFFIYLFLSLFFFDELSNKGRKSIRLHQIWRHFDAFFPPLIIIHTIPTMGVPTSSPRKSFTSTSQSLRVCPAFCKTQKVTCHVYKFSLVSPRLHKKCCLCTITARWHYLPHLTIIMTSKPDH